MLSQTHKKRLLVGAGIFFLIAVLITLIGKFYFTAKNLTEFITYLQSFGPWGYFVFFLLYAVLATLSFPTTPLTILAGVMFSYLWGVTICIFSANVAAAGAFLLARYFARDSVTRYLARVKNAEQILSLVKRESVKLVILLRLNPFIPASIKNYGFGITPVSFRKYVIASFIGQIPLILIYVYLGYVGGITMVEGESRPETTHLLMLAGGVVVSIILLVVVSFYGNRWLKRQTATPSQLISA